MFVFSRVIDVGIGFEGTANPPQDDCSRLLVSGMSKPILQVKNKALEIIMPVWVANELWR